MFFIELEPANIPLTVNEGFFLLSPAPPHPHQHCFLCIQGQGVWVATPNAVLAGEPYTVPGIEPKCYVQG